RLLLRSLAGIRGDHQRIASQLLAGRFKRRRIGPRDCDSRPLPQKLAGRFETNPTRAARNERTLPLEPVHVLLYPLPEHWWSGPPACHVGSHADILQVVGAPPMSPRMAI